MHVWEKLIICNLINTLDSTLQKTHLGVELLFCLIMTNLNEIIGYCKTKL